MWERRKISLPPSVNQINPAYETLPVGEAVYFFLAAQGLQGLQAFAAPHAATVAGASAVDAITAIGVSVQVVNRIRNCTSRRVFLPNRDGT